MLLQSVGNVKDGQAPASRPDARLLDELLPDQEVCFECEEALELPKGAIELRIDPRAKAFVYIPPKDARSKLMGGIPLKRAK